MEILATAVPIRSLLWGKVMGLAGAHADRVDRRGRRAADRVRDDDARADRGGTRPGWQITVAIATTVAAAAVFIRIGERLSERTLLHTSSRISYREALRAPHLRQAG